MKKNKKKEKYITERVSKAGSHSYEICIRVDGQSFRKSIKFSDFDTPSQALVFACKIRDAKLCDMRAGITVSQFPTVRKLYEDTFELFPVRIKTKYRHEVFFKNGIGNYADYSIDKVTSGDIQKTLNVYGKTHTARQTQGLLAIWRRIYKAAAMNNINIIDRTIAVTIPECMEDNPRPKSISPEDFETFCETLKDYGGASITACYRSNAVYYAVRIMRYTGCRPAEAFALTRDDIHLSQGYISINKEVRSTTDAYTNIGRTKTLKSVRNVPISDGLRPYLHECLAWSRNEFLLADYYGNLLEIDDVDVLVRNVRKKAKVNFTLYMLRHQFSTDLFNQGITPNVIRDLMGHESATMSLEYAVSNEKDRLQAVNNRIFS